MTRAFRIAFALVALALAILMLAVGHPSDGWWWALSIGVFAWVLSPISAAYLVYTRAEHLGLRTMMIVLSAGYAAFAAITFYSVFAEPDATSGLTFFAVPPVGWFGLPIAALVSALVTRFKQGAS